MELMRTASTSQGDTEEKPEVDLSCDSSLMRVLDRLILYLRVVHSVDYYNGTDYPYEDEMPNRCGIIHVRGATPDKCTLSEGTNIQTVFTFFSFRFTCEFPFESKTEDDWDINTVGFTN